MHYIVNLFIEPGDDLAGRIDSAMAPQREDIENEYDRAWVYNGGEWDWWVIGGRWSGYFDGKDQTTVGELASGRVKGEFPVPYAFITLPTAVGKAFRDVSRSWHKKEIYVPQGYWKSYRPFGAKEDKWGLSFFLEAPNYEKHFKDYLVSVPEDTVVVAIDIHS